MIASMHEKVAMPRQATLKAMTGLVALLKI